MERRRKQDSCKRKKRKCKNVKATKIEGKLSTVKPNERYHQNYKANKKARKRSAEKPKERNC